MITTKTTGNVCATRRNGVLMSDITYTYIYTHTDRFITLLGRLDAGRGSFGILKTIVNTIRFQYSRYIELNIIADINKT